MKKIFAFLIVMLLVVSSFALFCAFADDTEDDFEGGGDLSRLIVSKTTFEYGEPINITAYGTGLDYVGIYFPDDPYSIRWAYIDEKADKGVGSGVEFDIKTAGFDGSNGTDVLPLGEFEIRLQPNDSGDFSRTIAWVKIKIVIPEDAPLSEKPVSATYQLKNDTDGFAAGTLNVKLKENEIAKNIVPYWGNENGKLEGYTSLAKFKAKSTDVSYEFPEKLMIPEGATKLLVYTSNFFDQLSEECVVIDLPENSAYKDPGEPLVEFQVISDTHVVAKYEHTYNTNYVNMLKDIVSVSPNSMGIFISGDMVNNGNESEYKKMEQLYKSVEGAPPYYMAIGNHDLWAGTLAEQNALFLKYAKLPNGTRPKSVNYDFWLNGYHFVFLGNDELVSMIDATLNDETLKWLDKTLAEDRDAGRPTFLFLHQGIYNTVAGTLPGENWNGIVNSSELKFKMILRKYPEVIMFNGHSHWELDSNKTMYNRTASLPTIFNTSAVAYLCTGYNKTSGENTPGSEGYYIKVYEDQVIVRGRNFETGEWTASAQFHVDYENGTGQRKYKITLDNQGVGDTLAPISVLPNAVASITPPTAAGYIFEGWFTDKKCTKAFDPEKPIDSDMTLYAKWSEAAQTETPPESTAPLTQQSADKNTDSSAIIWIIVGSAVVAVAAVAVVIVVVKKKKTWAK